MRDGTALAARYSFITNRLSYCGPDGSYVRFLEYLKKPEPKLKTEIQSHIKRFEGFYPYLQVIAESSNLDPFDYEVVEAYWIGSKLLDSMTAAETKKVITLLSSRGLPKSYAAKLNKDIPKGMLPHHSFNVIYVGVGKVTGSVETNLENINNCLIRPGVILNLEKDKMVVQHMPYSVSEGKLTLGSAIESEVDYLAEFFENLKTGDTVSLHWNFAVGTLNERELRSVERYTEKNIAALERFIF